MHIPSGVTAPARYPAPLWPAFNAAVLHLANVYNPRGYAVSADAPSTLSELRECWRRDGRITVWSGASDQTIFGDPEVNYAFRAWHDATHLALGAEFDDNGEEAVCWRQIDNVRKLYGKRTATVFKGIISAEIQGQLHYEKRVGRFPRNQREFVLRYLGLGGGNAFDPAL